AVTSVALKLYTHGSADLGYGLTATIEGQLGRVITTAEARAADPEDGTAYVVVSGLTQAEKDHVHRTVAEVNRRLANARAEQPRARLPTRSPPWTAWATRTPWST